MHEEEEEYQPKLMRSVLLTHLGMEHVQRHMRHGINNNNNKRRLPLHNNNNNNNKFASCNNNIIILTTVRLPDLQHRRMPCRER